MTQMTVEASLRTRLASAETEIEFRDDDGALVGYFVPPSLHQELILAWSRARVTDAELNAARQESGGRAFADIWKDLQTR